MPTSSSKQNPELALLQMQRLRLLRKKKELLLKNGLAFYRPHAKQAAFHSASSFKRRMVRSGNRFGKSTMGCAEDAAWQLGERMWLDKADPNRCAGIPQHPVKLLTITTDWDIVNDVWTSQRGEEGKVWKFLPPDAIKSTRRNHSGAIDTIEVRRKDHPGCSLWKFDTVKSWMANPQGSESKDWDAIHVDEPCPEGMWKASARGLIDRGGSAWFTLTPLREPWINDYFFPQDVGASQSRGDVWSITGTTYDNIFLEPSAIKSFEDSLTEDERQCRIMGLPLHLAGLIYKEFQWDVHVLKTPPVGWKDYLTPPPNWPIYVAIDPHPQTPHAVLFCSVSPFGHRYFFHDIFQHCGIEFLVKGDARRSIQGILPFLRPRRPIWTKMDPLGFIEDPEDETCMATEAAVSGLPVEKATKALAQGILRVQQELAKRDANGHPVIHFAPTCRRTLWEIQRYCWDEKDNKPIDENDHMMENLYRLEISNMRWVDCTATYSPSIDDIEITRTELRLDDLNFAT